MNLLDILTILSYFGLTTDILLQAHRIRTTKSSEDVSVVGLSVRFFAIFFILYKLLLVGDIALIVGQSMIAITFTSYLFFVISYMPKAKKRRRR